MSDAATTFRNMVNIRELMMRLGVGRQTIYDWMDAGTFPRPVNVGNRGVRWYEDEVADWQKQREEQSLAPPRPQLLKPIKPRVGFRRPRRSNEDE